MKAPLNARLKILPSREGLKRDTTALTVALADAGIALCSFDDLDAALRARIA